MIELSFDSVDLLSLHQRIYERTDGRNDRYRGRTTRRIPLLVVTATPKEERV